MDYNGYICTYSGHEIAPLDPNWEDIYIEDIAHALGNSCRFTGHVRTFYSVAQHSVLVSELVPDRDAMWGLLHDATEAYLSDIARPVKQQPEFGDVYRAAETKLMRAVCERFDLPYEMPASVKEADDLVLANEIKRLMTAHPAFDSWMSYPGIRTFTPLPSEKATSLFIRRYVELGGS